MRQPANSARQFMQELIGTMNAFFKKMSRSNIQFQLSPQYALQKKTDPTIKSKTIKKNPKKNVEISPEKLKLLKKGFKKFKENKTADGLLLESTRGLSDKERAKHIKSLWKALDQSQRMIWCNPSKKTASKLKQKAGKPVQKEEMAAKKQK